MKENEPLITVSVIVAIGAAIVGLLVAFGVPLTDEQKSAVTTAIIVAAPLLVAWIARGKVTPTNNVVEFKPKADSLRVVAGPANEQVEPGKIVRYQPDLQNSPTNHPR